MMKRILSLVLAAALVLTALPALAVTNTSNIYSVVDFKFHHFPSGIGCGVCPVYTAPSLNAYRVGNAMVDSNHDMYIGGFDPSGWLMVRYETNNGGVRVGYVPPSYTKGFKTWQKTDFSYIQCVAQADLALSDNPMSRYSSFATIGKGATYWILGKYTYYGNWWYVECIVNGQYARGFVDRDTTTVQLAGGSATSATQSGQSGSTQSSTRSGSTAGAVYTPNPNYNPNTYGYPSRSPLGTPYLGTITVTHEASLVRRDASPNTDMVARANIYETYPYYESKIGSTGKLWYYIFVDGTWGWISSGLCHVN